MLTDPVAQRLPDWLQAYARVRRTAPAGAVVHHAVEIAHRRGHGTDAHLLVDAWPQAHEPWCLIEFGALQAQLHHPSGRCGANLADSAPVTDGFALIRDVSVCGSCLRSLPAALNDGLLGGLIAQVLRLVAFDSRPFDLAAWLAAHPDTWARLTPSARTSLLDGLARRPAAAAMAGHVGRFQAAEVASSDSIQPVVVHAPLVSPSPALLGPFTRDAVAVPDGMLLTLAVLPAGLLAHLEQPGCVVLSAGADMLQPGVLDTAAGLHAAAGGRPDQLADCVEQAADLAMLRLSGTHRH